MSSFTPVADPVYVHPLSKPITLGQSTISEIAIRKPNSMDLLGVGSPVISDPTSFKEAKLDFPVAFRMTWALSGVPETVLQQIEVAELIDLFWKIASFFIPGWQDLLPAMQKLKDQPSEPSEQPAA